MAGCLLSWLLRGWERIAMAVCCRTPTLHSDQTPGPPGSFTMSVEGPREVNTQSQAPLPSQLPSKQWVTLAQRQILCILWTETAVFQPGFTHHQRPKPSQVPCSAPRECSLGEGHPEQPFPTTQRSTCRLCTATTLLEPRHISSVQPWGFWNIFLNISNSNDTITHLSP